MGSVQLIFSTSTHPLSALIRLFTWSDWSHVGIVNGDQVIEADALHGVQSISVDDFIARASRVTPVDLACPDPDAVIAAALSQIGKPYDYTAIVGLGLHRDWQCNDAWFCSELVAWAFDEAGTPLFRRESTRRITPEHLWMLAPSPPPKQNQPVATQGRHERPFSF